MLASVMFWSGIALLVDSSIGLMFYERWQKLLKMNIQRLALCEVITGLFLISIYFLSVFGH